MDEAKRPHCEVCGVPILSSRCLYPDDPDCLYPNATKEAEVSKVEIPMPHVVIATPTLSKWVSIEHRDSMLGLVSMMIPRNIPHQIIGIGGIAYLDLARDILFTRFIDDFPDATDLFFIDDDVGFLPEKFIEFLIRPEPVLAGIYPKKSDETDFPVRLLADKETGALIENGGLVRADRAGAGFLRIKRDVCERMAAVAHKYRHPHGSGELYHVFSCGVAEDADLGGYGYFGEDVVFIQRCVGLGIEVWVDPNIDFAHSGHKTWRGNMLTELMKRSTHTPEGIKPDIGMMTEQEKIDA